MAASPQTWSVLQGIQWVLQNELLVVPAGGGSAVNPFTAWNTSANPDNPGSASDQTRYGANPNAGGGFTTNAIYIGIPKNIDPQYLAQCHVVLATEQSERYAHGGKVRVHHTVLIRALFNANDPSTDWLTQTHNAYNTADAVRVIVAKHAMLPTTAPTVIASKEDPGRHGYFYDELTGWSWLGWQTGVLVTEEFNVAGGIVS